MQDAIKNTAAVLHQLHNKDRDWILKKLPLDKKKQLRRALVDLKRVKSLQRLDFEEIYQLIKPSPQNPIEETVESEPTETPVESMVKALSAATMKEVQVVVESMSPEALVQLMGVTESSKIRRAVLAAGEEFSVKMKTAESTKVSHATMKVTDSLASYMTKQLNRL
ncbi:hypothetical protein A9Q99_08200 [Gammaproteobacteria bacterium 45_16_T64]|nr:hypothetical protein A9Q99_08200 [Gammaproteobacteria bacterium 45_16_T64]